MHEKELLRDWVLIKKGTAAAALFLHGTWTLHGTPKRVVTPLGHLCQKEYPCGSMNTLYCPCAYLPTFPPPFSSRPRLEQIGLVLAKPVCHHTQLPPNLSLRTNSPPFPPLLTSLLLWPTCYALPSKVAPHIIQFPLLPKEVSTA